MIRPPRSLAPLITVAVLAGATAFAHAVPLGVEGRVLDHRRNPVANYSVHVTKGLCGSVNVLTFSNGVFKAADDQACQGMWTVTVGPQTRLIQVLYGEGYTNTGDWILPAPVCREPCEVAPPEDEGPFATTGPDEVKPGDDDMPEGTKGPDETAPPAPGDDDSPNGTKGPDETAPPPPGDDDTPDAHAPVGTLALRVTSGNPFRGSVSMRLTVPRDARVLEGGMYDMAGRRIRSLPLSASAGTHVLQWDGRDEQGARVKPGLYFARVHGDLGRAGASVVLLP